MKLTDSKGIINNTEAYIVSASKAVQLSYPRLKTPYNEANPPKDINFHWFGDKTADQPETGEIKETVIKLETRVKKADLLTLAEEIGVDITNHKRVNQCIEAFEKVGFYVLVDLPKK